MAGAAAKADTLTFTLNSAYQSGGTTLYTFSGTIAYTNTDATNDSGVTEYLNGDSFSVSAPATLNDSSYIANAVLCASPKLHPSPDCS